MNRINVIDAVTGKIFLKNCTTKEAATVLKIRFTSINNAVSRDRLVQGKYKIIQLNNDSTYNKKFGSHEKEKEIKKDWDSTCNYLKSKISKYALSKIKLTKAEE